MNITELLTDLASGTNAIIRSTASSFNLTSSQAFHLISIPFDGIPMSGLSLKLGLDNSTLTRNIQKLEKMDLVKRRPDNYDKRIHRIVLTKKGTALLGLIEEKLEEQNADILEMIDLDAQEHILSVLEKLSWALECLREKP
jgi:DNA-binding MarR family transcriptional regulator